MLPRSWRSRSSLGAAKCSSCLIGMEACGDVAPVGCAAGSDPRLWRDRFDRRRGDDDRRPFRRGASLQPGSAWSRDRILQAARIGLARSPSRATATCDACSSSVYCLGRIGQGRDLSGVDAHKQPGDRGQRITTRHTSPRQTRRGSWPLTRRMNARRAPRACQRWARAVSFRIRRNARR